MKVKGADRAALNRLVEALQIFVLADSLGGVESMINHSWSMSHNSLSPAQKGEMGISENLLRLSVGIEDYRDLIDDLDGALKASAAVGLLAYRELRSLLRGMCKTCRSERSSR